jgi:hypothetical protein
MAVTISSLGWTPDHESKRCLEDQRNRVEVSMPHAAVVVPGDDSTEHGFGCRNSASRIWWRSSLSESLSFEIINARRTFSSRFRPKPSPSEITSAVLTGDL